MFLSKLIVYDEESHFRFLHISPVNSFLKRIRESLPWIKLRICSISHRVVGTLLARFVSLS